MLIKLEQSLNTVSEIVGKIAALLLILLLLNVFYDVIMRYVFNDVSIGMQEMEWHLYSSMFLLGIAYTLRHDAHVRVDLVYDRLSLTKKSWVNILGAIVFLLPITLVIGFYGISFTIESYQLNEQSGDPGGLSLRWLIKAMIPFSFAALFLSALGLILNNINALRSVTTLKKENQS